MAGDGLSTFNRKLKDGGCGCSDLVLPEDRIYVGGLRVFPARVLLPLKAAMVGIVEFDHEPVDGLSFLLHINENSTASVGQTIKRVDVMDEDNLSVDLQLQDRLEGRVHDAPGIVRFERLHRSARIFRPDGEQLSLHLVQLGVVPGIDLGVGAIDVDGVVETGVNAGTDSGLQQGNVFTCLVSSPHSVQQVPVDLVFTLAMVLFQAYHREELPQVSERVGQSMLLVDRRLEDISGFWRLKLIQVAKDKDRDATKDGVHHGDLSQSEVQVVEKIRRNHGDLIHDDTPEVPEEDSFGSPLFLRHGEEGGAKLEAEEGVEGLPIDVGRGCSCEGGEDDIRTVGVISRLAQNLRHQSV